jgi:hypothetical protein
MSISRLLKVRRRYFVFHVDIKNRSTSQMKYYSFTQNNVPMSFTIAIALRAVYGGVSPSIWYANDQVT